MGENTQGRTEKKKEKKARRGKKKTLHSTLLRGCSRRAVYMAGTEKPQTTHDTLNNPNGKGGMSQELWTCISARIHRAPIEHTPHHKPGGKNSRYLCE
jgi:hypothetical protein